MVSAGCGEICDLRASNRITEMENNCKQLRWLYLKGAISIRTYLDIKNLKTRSKIKSYNRKAFTLDKYTEEDCESYFRFSKDEILQLVVLLELPDTNTTKNKLCFSGLEALCTLLRRLCYPNRLLELVPMFSREPSAISRIYNWTLDFVYRRFRHLITTMDNPWLSPDKLNAFTNACRRAGSVLPGICGFIDGTIRPICRPSKNQKEQYSGYKKLHCLKYQSVLFPNGLIGKLDGPFNGRRHDSAILHLSGLVPVLQQKFTKPDGSWMKLYGDPGYSNSRYINVGYKGHTVLTSKQKMFNRSMSRLRVSVEYGFGKILQLFAFNDYKKNHKLLQQLKKQYIVSAILTNCHTCYRGSQVSDSFEISPPSIVEYLQDS